MALPETVADSAVSPSRQVTDADAHVLLLDVIRGLAALGVALLHIREINWIGMRGFSASHGLDIAPSALLAYASFPLVWGSIGVPVFFVLSGYVIHRGNKHRLQTTVDAKSFLRRRFVRIYPVFLAAIFLTWALDSWTISKGPHIKLGDITFHNAALNALAVVGIVGTPYGSNAALWSLPIEIQLYLCYPLALVGWRRLGPERQLMLMVGISALGCLLYYYFGFVCCLPYCVSWWLGAYVSDCELRSSLPKCNNWWAAGLICLGCAIYFLRHEIVTNTVWSLGFAMLLHSLLKRPLRLQSHPALSCFAFLGSISYSLYAVHTPVAVAFNALFLGGARPDSILWTFAVIPIVLMVACSFYFAIERPCVVALRRVRTARCEKRAICRR